MPQERVLLRSVLLAESSLRPHIRERVEALEAKDVELIDQLQRRRVGDSLNLDAASRKDLPDEHRWDYLLSVPESARLVGIEPHAVRDDQISVVIAKKRRAVQ